MRSAASSVLLVACTLTAATELPYFSIQKRDLHSGGRTRDVANGVVFKRQSGNVNGDGWLETNVYDVETWSLGGAYYANITVGTPPQEQVVIVDTGSADLYFDATSARTCQLPENNPNDCRGGTFSPSDSSTYEEADASPAFNTSFGDGSTALGPFGRDVVCIGDVCVSNVQFGVADEVDSTTGYAIGLMGVGYSFIEAVEQHEYPNIPEVLVDAGVINSRLYSVYLNDVESTGSILFGGIDSSLYTGDLVTLNFLPDANYLSYDQTFVIQFVQTITAMSATVGGQETQFWSGGSSDLNAYRRTDPSLPVLLDTGSAAFSMPSSYWQQYIAPTFTYIDNQGLCPCSYASSGDYVTVEMGGAVSVNVSAREFIVPVYDTVTREAMPYPGSDDTACAFMIRPRDASDGFTIAGDAILRGMYLVFDLDNGQVSIAQAKLNSTDRPSVTTIPAGTRGVAAAVSVATDQGQNSFPVAQPANVTVQFSASTLASTLGQATGTDAIPTIAQVEGESGSGSGSGSGSASSSGVAAGVPVPGFEWSTLWISTVAAIGIVTGMGLMI